MFRTIQSASIIAFAICLFASGLQAGSPLAAVPNLQRVNDHVYRGGLPSDEGLRELAAAGIRTVVNLREDDKRSKREKKLVKSLGMRYVHIPMRGMTKPSDKQISHALKVLKDDDAAPVFVHCQRCSDRTGVVMACYRMEHDRWSNQEALDEARSYGMSWYQFPLVRYISSYRPHHRDTVLENVADSVRGGAERAVDGLRHLIHR